jgi:uncharacterized protein (DUF58 family)
VLQRPQLERAQPTAARGAWDDVRATPSSTEDGPNSYAEVIDRVGEPDRLAVFNEAWLIMAVVCVVVGLASRQESMTLLGVLLLIVSLVARVWNHYVLNRVSYQRTLEPRRAFIGETVDLTLTVENRKLLPVAWLRVQDEWPADLHLAEDSNVRSDAGAASDVRYPSAGPGGAPVSELRTTPIPERNLLTNVFSLRWYERVRRHYTVLCEKRGYYRLGAARATSGDILGMQRREYAYSSLDWLLIYPRVLPIEELGLPPKNPFGEVRARQQIFEDPARTIGVRDHQPEDGFRRIHWKATARTQGARGARALQSKVYEPTTSFTLVTFVNVATFDRYWYGTIPELLERCITVAASVCAYAAERRYVIGVVANGTVPRSDQPIKVLPGRDPQQLSRVLEALAVVTPVATQSIAELLAHESPRLPWGATLAVVTANVNDELYSTLLRLHDAGRRLVLLSLAQDPPDPVVSEQILTYHLPDAASAYYPLQTSAAWQLSPVARREEVLAAWSQLAPAPALEDEGQGNRGQSAPTPVSGEPSALEDEGHSNRRVE